MGFVITVHSVFATDYVICLHYLNSAADPEFPRQRVPTYYLAKFLPKIA